MATTRILSQTEKEKVLAQVEPYGAFEAPQRKVARGVQPIRWEDRLGDLNEWRAHEGMGRAIVPVFLNAAKTQAVRNSIGNRLKRLYPDESWVTYIGGDGKFVYLKYGGKKRPTARSTSTISGLELFSQPA